MTKRSKCLAIIYIVLIVISIGIGIITKQSFKGDSILKETKYMTESGCKLSLFEEENVYGVYFSQNVRTLDDLIDQSEVILKVTPLENRRLYTQAIETKAKVIKVYKGEDSLSQKEISIYEPCAIPYDNIFESWGGYNIMQDEKEYFVFLTSVELPEGIQTQSVADRKYLPVSTLYAKYPVGSSSQLHTLKESEVKEGNIEYQAVSDLDIVSYDQKEIDQYKRMELSVKDKLSN